MDKKAFEKQAREVIEKDIKAITQLKEVTKPIPPENAIGRISRMDAINNRSVNEAALRTLEEKVKKVKIALTRMDDKDFGVCMKCKNTIAEGRLLLLPGTVFCVNCA